MPIIDSLAVPNAKNCFEMQTKHGRKNFKITPRQQKSQRTPEKYFNVIRSKAQQESDEDGPEEVIDDKLQNKFKRNDTDDEQ